MSKIGRTYIAIKLADVTQSMIDDCIEDSFATLRIVQLKNKQDDYTILKWRGNIPPSFSVIPNINGLIHRDMKQFLLNNAVPHSMI